MSVHAMFSRAAQDYDRTRRHFIPCFDELYAAVVTVLPFEPEANFRVLDLGAGTGLLSAILSAAYPNAHLTLADISTSMIEKSRERFGDDERFDYLILDHENQDFPTGFDAVVSALSIHHTPPEQLNTVFSRAFAALKPNGVFVQADQALGVTPAHEAKLEEIWQRDARRAGISENDLAVAIERMKADKAAPLEFQLQILRDVGFESVECWYKNFRFAVYSGQKPV